MPTNYNTLEIWLFQQTFNIGDLSPYMEDCFEDPSDLRSNPPEGGEVDVDQGIQESFLNQKTRLRY